MILNNTPQHEAILSNVGQIGEFNIRNSAKAFSILSSSLYSNPIRAIVRELSTNAVDSHVEAGKADTPFDIHLPNMLEPYFSIRDYGVGLSHDQVLSVYCTYFDSTKTESNAFIGALGLGSKTPFSYTENFTVTAIKNGRRGIYSAFVNEAGVPSIALLMEEASTEPSGLEIKFSVNSKNDFQKFITEASTVFTHFTLRPVISGCASFKFAEVKYETKDIIPGVHSKEKVNYNGRSVAVMGSIAYPIEIPNAEQALGKLEPLLDCSLEIHFDLGELSFQPSREGLHYIPSTIETIKRKLAKLNDQLLKHLTTEAEVFTNDWDRAEFLMEKANNTLWRSAVSKYVELNKPPLMEVHNGYNASAKHFELAVSDLAGKYNIRFSGFDRSRGTSACHTLRTSTTWTTPGPNQTSFPSWTIRVADKPRFVINDTKVGAVNRAKNHWRNKPRDTSIYTEVVHIMDPADKTKPMDVEAFLKDIHSPKRVFKASELTKVARASSVSSGDSTVFKMGTKHSRKRWWNDTIIWEASCPLESCDDAETYYYVPLHGSSIANGFPITETGTLYGWLRDCGLPALSKVTVFGVRARQLKAVRAKANWVPLEKLIGETLAKINGEAIEGMAVNAVSKWPWLQRNPTLMTLVKPDSPFRLTMEKFAGVQVMECNMTIIQNLSKHFAKDLVISPEKRVEEITKECKEIYDRYPLLKQLNSYRQSDYTSVAQYINALDEMGRLALDSMTKIV